MDFLKDVLGDELFGQVSVKLQGSSVKLADLSAGAYVSREKFDASQEALKAAQETLKGLGGKTVQQVQEEIDTWKGKAEEAEREAARRIDAMAFDTALSSALTRERARNPKTVEALLNRDMLKMADGVIVGLKEQLEKVKKENGFLFEPEPAGGAGFAGKEPPQAGKDANDYMNALIRGERGGQ